MADKRFSQPVSIFVGMGFAFDIHSVIEACRVLDEWTGSRSPSYAATLAVCQSALRGEREVESARIAFEAFARSRGILAPDALELAAARAADEWLAA
ncbi:DUF982 domain-containing protein [Mesorhizobium sp. BR1-1-9]|uniref:DUF982 domain-containing protein n=1 Tax=unclassified Mesorhizobium TaxID=325217 RepID=UPI001CD096E4|nr:MULTISPECIES: DUF982 domain-containing protein [unclassified Mesorhizobium]MBZ9872316.1 DUF982 domain-containing protein [Mesorhizobium sp. BR1-1-9]MBZ9944657.1 DUF982 domain-containing protein [Mesorhizobium sp. BR1-1-13]